ncbi:MAG: hypothetical protein AB7D46_02000 [Flavobacteriaceae bacterium]
MSKKFRTDEEFIKAFIILKDKVDKEEKRAIRFRNQLENQLNVLVKTGVIDDYNLQTNLMCFTSDKKINKKYKVEEGNPISEHPEYFIEKNSKFNWNERYHTQGSLLENLHFGYAMHCICFHSDLKAEEILSIDDVWIEIKVDYQFWIKK